ncbi:MAG: helix-turn-helix transcriptional regulator [Eubacteriales bacterium]|nr:helix-turn-helix transcriptional regulator [Eubacteriales bacterium]
MFHENLKALRQKKGYTQEALAIELHVVRQTVSKWEKGLSVPDADILQRLAEVLEVSVSQLLGADVPDDTQGRNEIAEQLARINEQLAISNRRSRWIWKIVFGILAVVGVAFVLLIVLGMVNYTNIDQEAAGKTEWTCTLNQQEYVYEVEYDSNYQVMTAGGDAFIANHADVESYDDANQVAAHIEDYFESRGGSVTVTREEGLRLME